MSEPLMDQVWALSALFLAAEGVVCLAEKGQWAEGNYACLMPSLQRSNCENVAGFYDNVACLSVGRDLLVERFGHHVTDDLLAYAMQMMHVSKSLLKRRELMQRLHTGLKQASSQIEYFGLLHDNVFARYGGLYQETASLAAKRIRVQGNVTYLQNPDTAARLRTVLLCGIRAAGLWQANGGGYMKVLFSRKKIISAAKKIDFNNLKIYFN